MRLFLDPAGLLEGIAEHGELLDLDIPLDATRIPSGSQGVQPIPAGKALFEERPGHSPPRRLKGLTLRIPKGTEFGIAPQPDRPESDLWVHFMDEEPSAVVVDANPFLDKRERLKPEYIIMRTPYGIYDDFLRLSPEANGGAIESDGEITDVPSPSSGKLTSEEVELWDDANAFALAYVAGDFGRIWDEFRPSSCRSTLTRQAYVEDRQASFHVYVYPPGTMEFLPPTDIEIDGERATFDFRTIEQARGYPDRLETLRVEAVREDGRWHFGIFVLRSDSGAWFYVPVDTETCGRPKGEQ
ncbi:MAG: hypothetical protein IH968_19080 [Gemmatimonadetes bacterium]|nr:hypothetical protein [Gemmatimonadota bacterium]